MRKGVLHLFKGVFPIDYRMDIIALNKADQSLKSKSMSDRDSLQSYSAQHERNRTDLRILPAEEADKRYLALWRNCCQRSGKVIAADQFQNVIDTGAVGQFHNFFGPVWVGTRIYTSPSTELERLGEFVLTSRSNDHACADRLRNLQTGKCDAARALDENGLTLSDIAGFGESEPCRQCCYR